MNRVSNKNTPLLTGNDTEKKRNEIRNYFHQTQDVYESLFKTLKNEESYYVKPISLRHPLIFYYGHTATFFINKFILSGMITERVNPKLESMFAVGVDEMSWDDLDNKNYDWPTVTTVKEYRNKVRQIVDELISTLPLNLPITWDSPWWTILMGIEHENIHLETSSVLIRQHNIKYVQSDPNWKPCDQKGSPPENKLIEVMSGVVELHKTKNNSEYYGWDNEFGHHTSSILNFQASQYLVSNQEFLEFVKVGGYDQMAYWTTEGWSWRLFSKTQHPTFWILRDNHWYYRTMTEEISMPWNWPVEVNYHEAKAFCLWKKEITGLPVRLPTEDEWYRIYESSQLKDSFNQINYNANIHLKHFASSCPITHFQHGDFYDVIGNVWQWTETPIYPFEGFEVHPHYDDFSTPTFDTKHNLIKGGSWISCGNESLKSARYAFRRHFFQHAGFRYVVSENSHIATPSLYESDKILSEYAEFHYGDSYLEVPNFPKAVAEIAISVMGNRPHKRALDLGCASGRATFELAQYFEKVIGIDFSARFIGQAVHLMKDGVLRYTLVEEGELVSYKERTLHSLGLQQTINNVEFYQGDACNLKENFDHFDLVLASNLIDRLYDPLQFLSHIQTRINSGGLLILCSPYTWLEEHTKKEHWIGGFKKDGETVTTLSGLKSILGKNFKLLEEPRSIPFVIRETKRKFQHSFSELTIWEKC